MSRHLKIALDMAKSLEKVDGIDAITMREIKALCLPPTRTFTAEQIKSIRESTHASQTVFASVLNVGRSTVEQWERGKKKPIGAAAKLLDLVERKGLEVLCPALKTIKVRSDISRPIGVKPGQTQEG